MLETRRNFWYNEIITIMVSSFFLNVQLNWYFDFLDIWIESFHIPTPNSTKHEMSETEKNGEWKIDRLLFFFYLKTFFLLFIEMMMEEREKKSSIGSCLNNSGEDLLLMSDGKQNNSLLIPLSSRVRTKHLLDLYNYCRFFCTITKLINPFNLYSKTQTIKSWYKSIFTNFIWND